MKKKKSDTQVEFIPSPERTFRIEVHKIWSKDDEYLHVVDGVTNLYEAVSEILNSLQLLYSDNEYKSMYLRLTWS